MNPKMDGRTREIGNRKDTRNIKTVNTSIVKYEIDKQETNENGNF